MKGLHWYIICSRISLLLMISTLIPHLPCSLMQQWPLYSKRATAIFLGYHRDCGAIFAPPNKSDSWFSGGSNMLKFIEGVTVIGKTSFFVFEYLTYYFCVITNDSRHCFSPNSTPHDHHNRKVDNFYLIIVYLTEKVSFRFCTKGWMKSDELGPELRPGL